MKKIKFFISSFCFHLNLMLVILLSSCSKKEVKNTDMNDIRYVQKNTLLGKNYIPSGKLENNPKERIRNAIIELNDLMKELMKNENVRDEIFWLSNSNLYNDFYIPLFDLINFQTSQLYGTVNIPENLKGAFVNEAKKFLTKDKYPNLYAIWTSTREKNMNLNTVISYPSYTNLEEYFKYTFLSLYVPYAPNYSNSNFDPILVPSLSDDFYDAIGYKPMPDGTYEIVNTNDSIASILPTVQITYLSKEELIKHSNNNNDNNDDYTYSTSCLCRYADNPENLLRPTYIGHIKLTKQLDGWAPWNTPNKGASELRIGRVDSKDAIYREDNSVVINSPSFETEILLKRHIIRKMKKNKTSSRYGLENGYKWISIEWDPNWECIKEGHPQVLYVYEKDDTEDRKIVEANLSLSADSTNYGININVNFPVFTDENIVLIKEWDDTSFFLFGLDDHGHGCIHGHNSFENDCWPIYEGGTIFNYTMPFKCVNLK